MYIVNHGVIIVAVMFAVFKFYDSYAKLLRREKTKYCDIHNIIVQTNYSQEDVMLTRFQDMTLLQIIQRVTRNKNRIHKQPIYLYYDCTRNSVFLVSYSDRLLFTHYDFLYHYISRIHYMDIP